MEVSLTESVHVTVVSSRADCCTECCVVTLSGFGLVGPAPALPSPSPQLSLSEKQTLHWEELYIVQRTCQGNIYCKCCVTISRQSTYNNTHKWLLGSNYHYYIIIRDRITFLFPSKEIFRQLDDTVDSGEKNVGLSTAARTQLPVQRIVEHPCPHWLLVYSVSQGDPLGLPLLLVPVLQNNSQPSYPGGVEPSEQEL